MIQTDTVTILYHKEWPVWQKFSRATRLYGIQEKPERGYWQYLSRELKQEIINTALLEDAMKKQQHK